jgi:hypothetical protein
MGRVRGGEAIAPIEREALLSMVKGCCDLMQIRRQWAGIGIAMECVSTEGQERVVLDESLGDLPDAHGAWVAARYTFVRGFWMTLGTPLVLGKGNDLKFEAYATEWDEIRMFGDCHHEAALLMMRMGLSMLEAEAGQEYRPQT